MKRLLALAFAIVATLPLRAADQPNILYIIADDHAAEAIGAYGGRLAALNPTPTIDRLAREGAMLKNCFCTNSICTPSRATILTGQYSNVNGIRTLIGSLPEARQALPTLMKAAGYETAMVGKWHLDAEPAAFDYYSVYPGQGSYFNPIYLERGPKPWPQKCAPGRGLRLHARERCGDRHLARVAEEPQVRQAILPHAPFQGAV